MVLQTPSNSEFFLEKDTLIFSHKKFPFHFFKTVKNKEEPITYGTVSKKQQEKTAESDPNDFRC